MSIDWIRLRIFGRLAVWRRNRRVDANNKRLAEFMRQASRAAPVPAYLFHPTDILTHYGNPAILGCYLVQVGYGETQQTTVMAELAKVRMPDGKIDLLWVSYASNAVPW